MFFSALFTSALALTVSARHLVHLDPRSLSDALSGLEPRSFDPNPADAALVPRWKSSGGRIAPRIVVISMFEPEGDVWLSRLPLVHNVSIPGASPLYPSAHCNYEGTICQFTTGESEVNAAGSTSALFLNSQFDFRKTYFLIAGIAGGNPHLVTTGSAAFASYSVQPFLQYALDPREIPSNWTTGLWSYGTTEPYEYPTELYGTEVFKVNTNLLARVWDLVKDVKLNDTTAAAEYRKVYDYAPANAYPKTVKCDVATSDEYFAGELLSEMVGNVTKVWTNSTAEYCSTAQEDTATLSSALRAQLAGLVDYGRFIVLRTISDFDRGPGGNVSAYTAFEAEQGGFPVSIQNLFVAGWPIVKEIAYDWKNWEAGTPHQKGFYGDILGTIATYD